MPDIVAQATLTKALLSSSILEQLKSKAAVRKSHFRDTFLRGHTPAWVKLRPMLECTSGPLGLKYYHYNIWEVIEKLGNDATRVYPGGRRPAEITALTRAVRFFSDPRFSNSAGLELSVFLKDQAAHIEACCLGAADALNKLPPQFSRVFPQNASLTFVSKDPFRLVYLLDDFILGEYSMSPIE